MKRKFTVKGVLSSTVILFLLTVEGLWSLFGILKDNQKSFDMEVVFILMQVVGVFGFSYYVITNILRFRARLDAMERHIEETVPNYLEFAFMAHLEFQKLSNDRTDDRIEKLLDEVAKIPFFTKKPISVSKKEQQLTKMNIDNFKRQLAEHLKKLRDIESE